MRECILYLAAAFLTIYGISLVVTSNFNMGNLLVWILAAAVDIYAIWHRPLDLWFKTGVGRAVWWVLLAGCVFMAGMLAFVAISGYTSPARGNEKVVVVLGAGLRKDRPSLLLRYRLDAAYDYAMKNTGAVVVTTGGQGMGETVPEGQAMRDYLVNRGLAPERIIAETKSTSTEENFRFAKTLLAERGIGADEPSVYVSNAFHCYRAGQYAKREGFTDARAVPAGISLRSVPTCYLREVFAVLYYWVFKTSASGPMHAMVGLLDISKKMFYK